VPPRTYGAIAELLAEAVEAAGADEAAYEAARLRGRAEAGPGDVVALLVERGYEPESVDGTVRLRNCPRSATRPACATSARSSPATHPAGVGPTMSPSSVR
jgi:hypothetical protein